MAGSMLFVLATLFGACTTGDDDDDGTSPTQVPGDDDDDTQPTSPPGDDDDTGPGDDDDTSPDTPTPGETYVLNRPSRSSTIAISSDDAYVIMSNPADDSVSIFRTSDNTRTAKVTTGDEPEAVVIHPDASTAFVANRADATVVKITDIDTGSPKVSTPLEVGSEPTGLALSPTGAKLFVAEFAEGRVSVIDTRTMRIVGTIDPPQNPRAIAVTNDFDENDNDELVVIPEFFGEKGEGAEGTDTSRVGRVRIYRVDNLTATDPIVFNPRDSTFVPDGTSAGTVFTSPNQLGSVAINGNKIYVTSISASPAGPPKFNGNVFPIIYVGDLNTRQEDTSGGGTVNLAQKVKEALPEGQTRYFLADLVDIEFKGGAASSTSVISYALSKGTDVMQRMVFEPDNVTIGSSINKQIDMNPAPAGASAGCTVPTGMALSFSGNVAYVNCRHSRRLGVVDFGEQRLVTTIEASNPPTGGDVALNDGFKFFFTARGRWSKEGWSGCGSCHPDGLTDNITWMFAAGPRQTTSMDGTVSKGPAQKRRVYNWTAIFDEIHDFERNTRDVSGGKGAITTAPGGTCGNLAQEVAVTLSGNLDKPVKESQDETEGVCTNDWDDIDAWVKTIRPPRGLRFLDQASVARGAKLFSADPTGNNGGCVRCHGGAGWTVSRRFWTPSEAENADLKASTFTEPDLWPDLWNYHTLEISTQPAISADETGPAEAAAVGPDEVACVLRNVGTFGVPGDTSGTDALEKKANGQRAQGRGGFNVPSLYGLQLGAPYLHHGQASTLDELLDDPLWSIHLTAGNPNFAPNDQQREDLVNFLLSIDADTEEQDIPDGYDGCED